VNETRARGELRREVEQVGGRDGIGGPASIRGAIERLGDHRDGARIATGGSKHRLMRGF